VIELMRELIEKHLLDIQQRWFFRHPGCLKSHRVFTLVDLNKDAWKDLAADFSVRAWHQRIKRFLGTCSCLLPP
jgi:hypothetical protein